MVVILRHIIISVLVSLMVSVLVIWLFVGFKQQGYVDMVKLNDEFELKLFLQKELDGELSDGRKELDNLKLDLQRLYNDSSVIGEDRFVKVKQLQTDIDRKRYENDQLEQDLTTKYNEQIWTQLNVYIREFGKDQGVEVLFGAAGQGTILYGDEGYDLTEECIAFVNSKYRGE